MAQQHQQVNASTHEFCYLDLDIDHQRSRLALAAAFVHATDSRYGFSSGDLRLLGGSEIARLQESIALDHEWSQRLAELPGNKSILSKGPVEGNRVVVQLFWDVAPMACQNFATLCSNGWQKATAPVGESGKPLTYRGSTVHRIIPGFVLQGGDFVFGNGSGGESIFNGKKFKDERAGLNLSHDRPGLLSMGNSGKNSNSSQFFITLAPAPKCDGKHVIFGKVISGMPVIRAAEQAAGTPEGNPKVPVTITDCGPWMPLETPAAGHWYDQPNPEDSFSGISPIFMVRPRVAVVVPSAAVGDRFREVLQSTCTLVEQIIILPYNNNAMEDRIPQLLQDFAVDVILVAPACSNQVQVQDPAQLPHQYQSVGIHQVILTAKPLEAISVVHSKSWLATTQSSSWQFLASYS